MAAAPFITALCLLIAGATETDYNWEPRISLPGQCGPKEYYNDCGSTCVLNCYTAQVIIPCRNNECSAGCFCKGGFLRKGLGGPCVPEKACSKFAVARKRVIRKLIRDVMKDMLINLDE